MVDRPKRIQLSRAKGWRLPPDTVNVTRPGKWGNSARVVETGLLRTGEEDEDGNDVMQGPWACLISKPDTPPCGWWFATRDEAVAKAIEYHRFRIVELKAIDPSELRGQDVACWCGLDQPCHGDTLLELANVEPSA